MTKETFSVTGMMCEHCEKTVNAALCALPGVRKAKVSHKKGRVDIQYDEAQTSLAEIKSAVVDAGYELA